MPMLRRDFMASLTTAALHRPGVASPSTPPALRLASLDGSGRRVAEQLQRLMPAARVRWQRLAHPAALPQPVVWVLSAATLEQLALAADPGPGPGQWIHPSQTVLAFEPFGFEAEPRLAACQAWLAQASDAGLRLLPVPCDTIARALPADATLAQAQDDCERWAAHALQTALRATTPPR